LPRTRKTDGCRYGAGVNWTGTGGNDAKTGGTGADTLLGGGGADTLTGGDGADSLSGGSYSDSLVGGAGADTINGGTGTDVLYGGSGADNLYGGTSADRFVFRSTSDSPTSARDSIRDFSHSQGDKIDLSGIDAKTTVAGDQAFTLVSSFTKVAGQLTVGAEGDHLVVAGDVTGDGVADFAINVYTTLKPSGADFIF